ncbi:hypothetical protein I4U23_029900 [Adineta vaga]|nr:hypothetical protein I4U23_029900 [Adineta vaga]
MSVSQIDTIESSWTQESDPKDDHNFTHPRGFNPIIYLEQVRQQSRLDKMLTLQKSLTDMIQSPSNKGQQHEILHISEDLKTIHSTLLTLTDFDIENATRYGKEIIMIIINLLYYVITQIGQTNIQISTLESMLAYIRNLIHTRSVHMREITPGSLLIAWYELSHLMSIMQMESELKITNKKAIQLLNIANRTVAWAYKYLSTEWIDDLDDIKYIDRHSIPYTYE